MKNFSDLSEQEVRALAITLEVEDSRVYGELHMAYVRTTRIQRRY
jgi:hypothetical protein